MIRLLPKGLQFDQNIGVCNRPEALTEGACQSGAGSGSGSSEQINCSSEGLFRHPADCSKFYRCEASGNQFTTYQFSCTGGLIFDESIQGCNYPGKY